MPRNDSKRRRLEENEEDAAADNVPTIADIHNTESGVNLSCDPCRRYKRACNHQRPCTHCLKKGYECVYSAKKHRRNRYKTPAPVKQSEADDADTLNLAMDEDLVKFANENRSLLELAPNDALMSAIHQAASYHLETLQILDEPSPYNFLDGTALIAFAVLAEELVNKTLEEALL